MNRFQATYWATFYFEWIDDVGIVTIFKLCTPYSGTSALSRLLIRIFLVIIIIFFHHRRRYLYYHHHHRWHVMILS